MNFAVKWILFLFVFTGAVGAAKPPHIGYAYPAGGRQGNTVRVMIGGQYLNDAVGVLVSGEGISVEIVKYTVKYEPRRLRQIYRNKENSLSALEGKEGKELENLKRRITQAEKQLALAEIPEGVDINNKKQAQKYYRGNAKEQFNPQIADRLRIDITIAEDAPPGVRELRVDTAAGLSNPIYFQIGTLREVYESEPNDDHMIPMLQTVPLPSMINGQILPGDIDHFRFKALKGQSIVVDVGARKIIPYLADAVPGWFQAVVALYDEEGNEVAYQDDYKFNPDPVLFFDVPKPGTYTLSIKDSIYRGREDFVYRIAIGELPFITAIFPLGGRQGEKTEIAMVGKNLPKTRLSGKLTEGAGEIRHISVNKKGYRSNVMPFATGDLAEVFEAEPNNTQEEAQAIEQPLTVNGRIQKVGDVDVFSFHGKKGDSVSVAVVARRLNSPLDSFVSLSGPGIETPLRNDDYMGRNDAYLHLGAGLITHHADSYLQHRLPTTGTYYVQIGDTQSKGGIDYAYRLHITPSHPGFELTMEPSGLHIAPGGTAAFSVRVLRSDGFDGAIELEAKNLPPGFEMSMTPIPAGSDTARFTITAPKKITELSVSPEIVGTAMIDGKLVVRVAVPVDNQMQAFLYRHLVPARELVLASVTDPVPLILEVRVPASGMIELPLGKEKQIRVAGTIWKGLKGAKLVLDHPPEGLTVVKGWIGPKRTKEKSKKGEASGQIILKAEAPLQPGDTITLVVAAEVRKGREVTLYPTPAISVQIVEPQDE